MKFGIAIREWLGPRVLVALFVVGITPTVHAIYQPGRYVKFLMSTRARTRLKDSRGEQAGFLEVLIPAETQATVLSVTTRAQVEIDTVEVKFRDDERICDPEGGLLSLVVEVPFNSLEGDYRAAYREELSKTLQKLKDLYPGMDLSALDRQAAEARNFSVITPEMDSMGSIRVLLIQTCGDPRRIQEFEKLTPSEFAEKLSSEDRQQVSTDYPVLAEIQKSLEDLGITTLEKYREILKDRNEPVRQNLHHVREVIRTVVETSEIARPSVMGLRKIRQTFSSPLMQQFLMEEIAARYWEASRKPSTEKCQALIRAFHLFQHVDASYPPFGFEKSNSVLALYAILDPPYFRAKACQSEIMQEFDSWKNELPYFLPPIINPALFSQYTVRQYVLGIIPVKTETLNEDEWAANIPNLGRIIMVSQKYQYFWKEKSASDPDRITHSEDLLKLWYKRARQ
jgi:hypothetical protein